MTNTGITHFDSQVKKKHLHVTIDESKVDFQVSKWLRNATIFLSIMLIIQTYFIADGQSGHRYSVRVLMTN